MTANVEECVSKSINFKQSFKTIYIYEHWQQLRAILVQQWASTAADGLFQSDLDLLLEC